MKTSRPRETPEAEALFRTPEQLALAMPLIAVPGLVAVVSAVALGASGPVIALVAVGGFGLCALAPMALIEAFVTGPLRGALAQLRAARDGRGARGPDFGSGVLADLVHIARDLHAAQANLGPGALSPLPDLSEDAVRALRHQAESLAEAAAEGESQIARAAQACVADIAQAIKSMCEAPGAAGFDAAVERLEAMLVYIAETQERAEAKDRQFQGAFGRVEIGMADLSRLVARETDTLQGALSNHGLLARNDIAAALTQEKAGRARVLDRLDALETRLAKGADGVVAEVARVAQAIGADRASAQAPGADDRLDAIAAALSRLEAENALAAARPALAEGLGQDLRGLGAVVTRLADEFSGREPVEAALRGVCETLAACFQDADFAGLRADARETAAALAAQVETLRVPAGLDRNDLRAALAATAADLSRQIADVGARFASGRDDEARQLTQAARSLTDATARLEAGEGAAAAFAGIVARGVDAIAERIGALDESDAWRLDALGARLEDRLDVQGRDHAQWVENAVREAETRTSDAFALASDNLGSVACRLELAHAQQDLRGETARRLAETVERALADVAARTEAAAHRQRERLDAFAEQTIDPARQALAGAARDFAAASGDIAAVRARLEAGEPALARMVEATQGACAQLGGLAESLPRAFAQTADAQAERLAARLDAVTLAPTRDALAQATESFAAAQGRLTQAAATLEAGDPRLALVAEAAKALRIEVSALAEYLPDALCARVGAGSLVPAREALTEAARAFDAARMRLDDGAESLARLRGDFVASEARFGHRLEEAVARMAALGFERLPDLVGDLAAMQAQWRTQLGEFDRSAGALASFANVEAHPVAALRDAFAGAERNLRAAIVDLAPGVQAAAAAQGDRIMRAMETRERQRALELGAAIQGLADVQTRLAPALTHAPTPERFDALRADLAALSETTASRFEAAAQSLARRIEERVESGRQGDVAFPALALQAATQETGKTHAELFVQVDALKAALAGDRSAFAAMRQDFVQAVATVTLLGERVEALTASLGAIAGAERAELAAVAQALAKIGERVEFAARAFEDRRGGDFATLGADLTRDIDALARVTAERVIALEGGVETLTHAAVATLSQMRDTTREATRAFSGLGFEAIVRRLDPLAELPGLTRDLRAILAQTSASDDGRSALDALGAGLAPTLEAVGRQLQAQPKTGGADPASVASSAVANLALSMADALEARFSQIEAGLIDLGARLMSGDHARLDADLAALATQLNAASRALKASLSDFVGVRTALVEEMSAKASPALTAAFYKG